MQNQVTEETTNISEGYRLSPHQRHLWLLQQTEKKSTFFTQCSILIPGNLDTQILKSALDKIVEHHEIFRTNFDCLPGMTVGVQIIRDSQISWNAEYDLTPLKPEQKNAELEKIWQNFSQIEFDLKQDSLFRVSLVKISPAQQILLINLPALISDSKTLEILVRELNQEYTAFLEENQLPEAELQYADIAEWQNELLEEEEAKLGKEFWQKQDISHRFDLRLPFEQTFEQKSEEFKPQVQKTTINPDLFAKIKSLAQQLDVSTSDFLLTCWLTLIWRLTGESNIVLGLVGNGRKYEELEQALGLFAKHLPLCCQVSEELKFNQLLEQVKLSVSEVLKWQDYFTWEQFIALTDTYFQQSFLPLAFEFIELNNISENFDFTIDRIYTCIDKYKIKLVVTENQNLSIEFHYDANAYQTEDIQRLTRQFQTLLTNVLENPVTEINQFQINNEQDLQKLLIEFNNTEKDYGKNTESKCIHHIFEEQSKLTPKNIAVVFEDQQISYEELNAKSNQLAHYLQKKGIKPDVAVGIYSDRSLEIIIAILAILKAGGAYLPLDSKLPTENLSFRLEDANVPTVLTKQHLVKNVPDSGAETICLDSDWDKISQESTENLKSEVTPENLIYIIYTSGSTGKPKGVAVEHQQVLNYLYSIQEKLELSSIATYAIISTFAADLGNTVLFPSLCFGGCLHIISEERTFDAEALTEYFSTHPIDCLKIVPSHLEALLSASHPEKILPRQSLILGGEALSWELVERIQKLRPDCQIFNHYGPSETTVGVTTFKLTKLTSFEYSRYSKTVPLGSPNANTQIHILDKNQQSVPIGVVGELHIGGAGLARGYLNRPELTAEKFITGIGNRLYRTGDLARYLPDGNIEFIGRIDNQVKIRGFRIELGEIESVISTHPQIEQTVVICREDNPGDKRLVAYIVNLDSSLNSSELQPYLLSKLPEYMVPSAFVFLETIPLTANGKIDRKALPAPDIDLNQTSEYTPPQNPTQEILANIFAEVLAVTSVGIHDNFFVLGGHSLLAIKVISRIKQFLSAEISVKDLFESPTIAELEQLIQNSTKRQTPPIEPIPRNGEPLPLSWAQERMWFLDQLEEESATYNIPKALRIKGNFNYDAFTRAMAEIIHRHEVLRTRFEAIDGIPGQVIEPDINFQVQVIDWQHLPSTQQEADLPQYILQEATKPFNLNIAPLLRVNMVQLSETESLLLMTVHHIVCDAWSFEVLMKEFLILYTAYVQGETSTLTELPIQYADFSVWQRKSLKEQNEIQLNYWQQQLAAAPTLLQLPTDRPRPAVPSHKGALHKFELSKELTQQLENLSQLSGTTLFMTVEAAFATLLYRYSGQSDILVGSSITNRHRSEVEPLIGFFLNALALRTKFEDNPTFVELLAQVRKVCLEAYSNQDVPFEQVIDALQVERNMSHSPLFQVMFVLQNAPEEFLELPGVELNPLWPETNTARFDIILSLLRTNEGLVGSWEYATDLFDAETMARMTAHFQNLLSAIVTNPEQKVAQIPLLTEAERHQLLIEWNNTAVEYPKDKCIHQLFEEQVEKTPDAVAVVFEQQQLTYKQLNAKANQLAHYLQSLGVKTETLVGICINRSLEMMVGLLGILKAGAAYVPLDPSYPKERLAYMLEDAAMPVLLTNESLLSSLPEHSAQVVCLDSNWDTIAHQSIDNPVSGVAPENLAYIIYTSGSTGKPKGTMIIHTGVVNYLSWCTQAYQLTQGNGVPVNSSIGFDATITSLFSPLLKGQQVILLPEEDEIEALSQLLCSQNNLSLVKLTPAHLQILNTLIPPEKASNQTRAFIIGGEALPVNTVSYWSSNAPQTRLINEYGPTETVVGCCVYQVEPEKSYQEIVPIGRPIANTQLYILDSNNQPVPIGVAGELHIGGAGLARGYLKRPELTAEKFIPNPFDNNSKLYKTGDLARYLPNGNIEYLGRIDNQVKIRGYRIEIGEIESSLSTHPQIEQTVVLCREDNPGHKRLVAYVVSSDTSLNTADLQSYLLSKLPEYMVPSAFVVLETLPLTSNGKIDRKALLAPELELTNLSEYVPPQTPVEKILASIWQDLLGIEKVSIHDNFFSVGGDSILSIQLVARVRTLAEESGINITPKQIFQHPTIAQLAKISQEDTTTAILAQQGTVTGIVSLTPIQKWFFEQNLSESHHFNQSVFFQVPHTVQPELLSQSLSKLLEHHDALRLRFLHGEKGWQQNNQELDETVPFQVINLSDIPQSQQSATLSEIANNQQGSLNLSEGPLLRAVLFQLGNNGNRLLIIIHHLAVDGVSWRILLQDLLTVYQQLEQGQTVKLPPKTTAFIDWAKKLHQVAQSEIIKQELDYWSNKPWSKICSLPLDYADTQIDNTVGSIASVSVKLSVEETGVLLGQVNKAYNTQINDILLSALVMSLAEWTGNSTVLINLEGHGREELFSDVDLSRTVGWFTSLFPVLLQLPKDNQTASIIKSIKEQLRAIPNRGIGFGILRYLSLETAVTEQLQKIPTPEIVFNYLGQFDQVQSATDWKPAPESTGANRSSEQIRDHLLNINSLVVEGELQISYSYSNNVHNQATVEHLAQSYLQAIRVIIEHCQSDDAFGYTPSDFPLTQLNQLELDKLLAVINNREISAIYPLSPMQQGLLFHNLYAPESRVYFKQMSLEFKGQLDVAAFASAWQKVVDRHSILRTLFVWENISTPLQVVLKQVNLPWTNLDWVQLSPTEQQEKFKELLSKQKAQGFSFSKAPLMNCTLIKLSVDTYKFIWNHHHILLDGWSSPIIYKEIFSFYNSAVNGETYQWSTPSPYRDYIAWLCSQDQQAAMQFWRQNLHGFKTPTPLMVNKTKSVSKEHSGNKQIELGFSSECSKKLQSLAKQYHLTVSTIAQAAWALLLNRYSGETDVVFGVVVSGRNTNFTGVENIVGLLINTLPLRVQVPTKSELIPWLKQIQESMVELQQYSYTPIVDIQAVSQVSGGIPLFNSIMLFQNYPIAPSLVNEESSLQLTEVNTFQQSNYPLSVYVVPGDKFLVKITYNAADFELETVQQMLRHLQTLLTNIADNPDTKIKDLEMLTESEKEDQRAAKAKRTKANFKKFKSIKPKAVSLPEKDLIKTSYLQPEETLPLVIEPNSEEVDIADWAMNNREFFETNLRQHGAILLKDFHIDSISKFEKVAGSITPGLFGEYGDLPREGVSKKVYGSTPYPEDKAILFHNESSHLHRWPQKIFFLCLKAAESGGETPIVDCRKVYQMLSHKLREKLEEKQLMYVRNYVEDLDVSWQDFFHTNNKSEVESYCKNARIEFEWLENNGLKTSKVRPAITTHPKTGEKIFFNQIQLHHISYLDAAVRESLLSEFGEKRLPRNVYYGDGSPIEDSVIEEIGAIYEKAAINFPWQAGNMIMLDNMLIAHGRNPYVGERKIVVAMGDLMEEELEKKA
ncbi:MAG: amino acid adenylation domain-containing protein [Cyanobacteria bacterium P01_H01_bin.35]